MLEYLIRPIKKSEYFILDDFLYEAIFVDKNDLKPSKDVIKKPELQIYVQDFGKYKDDLCLVIEINKKIVGACWTRIMDDYGHIDKETPSLAISLYSEFRNRGLGSKLLMAMLTLLKSKNYKNVSLSVQKKNFAVNMYKRCGFEIFKETNEEYIMIYSLNK